MFKIGFKNQVFVFKAILPIFGAQNTKFKFCEVISNSAQKIENRRKFCYLATLSEKAASVFGAKFKFGRRRFKGALRSFCISMTVYSNQFAVKASQIIQSHHHST